MSTILDDPSQSKLSVTYWYMSAQFFARDWWYSRPRGILNAIAIVALAIALFFVLSVVPRAWQQSIRGQYENRWQVAIQKEDWLLADIWIQKAISLGDRKPTTQYQLGLISEKLGRDSHAQAVIGKLADDFNYPKAHAWLAMRALTDNASTSQIRYAIHHLENAVKADGEEIRARVALGEAYRRAGELQKAALQIRAAAVKDEMYRLPLAFLYIELKDPSEAKAQALLADKFLDQKLQKSPGNIELLKAAADAKMLQGKWQEAIQYISRYAADESSAKVLRSRVRTFGANELIRNPATQLDSLRQLYLALDEDPGNRSALVLLARLAPAIVKISIADVAPIKKWMQIAHDAAPDDIELAALLGNLEMLPEGNPRHAEELFERVSKSEPIALLELARAQEAQGKSGHADASLKLAIERLTAPDFQKTESTVIATAEAHARLGRFDIAREIVGDYMKLKSSELLAQMMAQLYNREAQSESLTLDRRIELLCLATKSSSSLGHATSESQLARLAQDNPANRETIIANMRKQIANANGIRSGHMVLGLIAANDGNWDETVFHFEQTLSHSAQDPELQNNLAWALSSRNQAGDLTRALQLVEAALVRLPLNPEFRETRGLVKLAMKQWEASISDFEFALSAFPNRKSLHLLLAKAYRGKGDEKMALIHEERAK